MSRVCRMRDEKSIGTTRMNVPQLEGLSIPVMRDRAENIGPDALRHNQDVIVGAVRRIWRRRRWVIGSVVAAVVVATIFLLAVQKEYVAYTLLRLEFVGGSQAGVARVQLDASALVESEARILRSVNLMKKIVTRNDLYTQGNAATPPGWWPGLRGLLSGSQSNRAGTVSAKQDDKDFDAFVAGMVRRTSIENDSKSYLIGIRFRAASPDFAATAANAIARTYLQERLSQTLLALRSRLEGELAQLDEVYGPLHPKRAQTKARLDEMQNRIALWDARPDDVRRVQLEQFSLEIAFEALSPTSPVWPSPRTVYPMLILLFTVGTVAGILLWDRRDTGFSSATALARATGLRCLGMVPDAATARLSQFRQIRDEAYRAILVAAALEHKSPACRVIVVTSPLPDPDLPSFTRELASAFGKLGNRTLVLDATYQPGGSEDTVKDAASGASAPLQFDGRMKGYRAVDGLNLDLPSKSESGPPMDDCGIDKVISHLREQYDVVLVTAPAALLFSTAIEAARLSDRLILTARWSGTPRKVVMAAVQRLREAGICLTGAVLTHVDFETHAEDGIPDSAFYLAKYRNAFTQ